MPLLKLDQDDPEKEREFEIKCALELTPEERIHKLLMHSEAMLKLAKRYENRRTYQVIKRELR